MSMPATTSPDVSRFFAVDEVAEPDQLIKFLDVAKALPGITAAKAEILERLGPERAASALDVGCGYGTDVIELAKRVRPGGRAIGLDISEAMITEARRRVAKAGVDVSFKTGDAVALPFEDNTFDICRIETVLQHLAEPGQAVAEMARVTKPSGRIAALEFDLGTLFIDHPDAELSETIRASFTHAAVQGSMGRQLQRLFVEVGLTDVDAAPRVISTSPSFFRLLLGHHVDHLCAAGAIDRDQGRRWWATMDESAAGGYFAGGATAFVVWGTVN